MQTRTVSIIRRHLVLYTKAMLPPSCLTVQRLTLATMLRLVGNRYAVTSTFSELGTRINEI